MATALASSRRGSSASARNSVTLERAEPRHSPSASLQQRTRPFDVARLPRLGAEPAEPLELKEVQTGVAGVQRVTRQLAHDPHTVSQPHAQPGDVRVDLRAHRDRRIPPPQQLAQPCVGDHAAPGQQQCGKHRLDLGPRQHDGLAVSSGFHRTENSELHDSPSADAFRCSVCEREGLCGGFGPVRRLRWQLFASRWPQGRRGAGKPGGDRAGTGQGAAPTAAGAAPSGCMGSSVRPPRPPWHAPG